MVLESRYGVAQRDSVIQIDETGCNLDLLKGLDLSRQKTIAIFGVNGSLVKRFLASGFSDVKKIFPNVKFVGVDLHQKPLDHLKSLGLPWRDVFYFTPEEFKKNWEKVGVDGVIAAVPPNDHLGIAKEWSERGIAVWVEKPLVLPSQLKEMEALIKSNPGKIFPADFYIDSAPVNFLLKNIELLQSIGKIKRFDGRLIENIPLERGREWLMDPKISGGGLGMDILVHPLALADKLFDALGIVDPIQIEDVVCGTYEDLTEELQTEEETYMYVKGRAGNVAVYIDGGKGVSQLYYGVSLTGEYGTIDIFTGTENCDPYINIQNSENKIFTFPNKGVGYEGTFFDFLLLLYGSSESCYTSLPERLKAGINSINYMKNAYSKAKKKECVVYKLGEEPPVPVKPRGQTLPFMIEEKRT
ncbi:MAG: hypothetical protein Q8P80_03810 [Candidatus Levybacteria bacterium]|nr:hypothetical protein [Candidatus Levybacteria bacterium]